MNENKIAVNIPKSLHAEIELRVKRSNGAFKSVEDYVEFVKQDNEAAADKVKPKENEEMKKGLEA